MLRSLVRWLRRSSSPITRKPSRVRLAFDTLEARDVPANFTVTTGADSGAGSLREAIGFANTNGQNDTITFAAGVNTVTLTSAQLTLSESNTSTTISGGASTVTIQRSLAGGTPNFRVLEVNDFTHTLTLVKLAIENGVDTGSSGGGGVLSRGATTLNDCTLQDNQAGSGAGIFCNNTLTLNRCVISGNTAGSQGGGVWNSTGLLTVNSSTIQNNSANDQGGGIFKSGSFNLTNSLVRDNTSSLGGGLNYTGSGTIVGSTFQLNDAVLGGAVAEPGDGGAIWGLGDLAITNSTLANNSAVTKGGAVYFRGYVFTNANLVVTNATIAFNSAGSSSSDGGGIFIDTFNPTALVTLKNTIVAFNTNTAGSTFAEIGGGNVTAASSYNLVRDASTAGGLTNAVNGNKVGVDPKLATILPATNGGPTPTFALLPDSPAIDAGVNGAPAATTDQRGAGFPRVIGGRVDIGAVEFFYTTQIVYDSNGNLLVKDISGRNDDFTVAKDGANVVIRNSAGRFRSPVGTVSADGLTLSIPLTTIRGRLTIAGGDGDDTAFFSTDNRFFPVFFGSMRFDGGAGVDTFIAGGDVSATLSDTLFLMSASKRILLAAGTVAKPERAIILGGASANIFDARTYTGTAVLDGREGNDKLLGSSTGHNILIGGLGSDILQGSATNRDLLIGGNYTGANTFDATFTPVIDKWVTVTSSNFFVVVAQMKAGTGIGASLAFTAARLPNDNAKDTIYGLGKNDWYWAYLLDVTDKSNDGVGTNADAQN